jgi:hypothetical protein
MDWWSCDAERTSARGSKVAASIDWVAMIDGTIHMLDAGDGSIKVTFASIRGTGSHPVSGAEQARHFHYANNLVVGRFEIGWRA